MSYTSNVMQQVSRGGQNDLNKSVSPETKDASSRVVDDIPSSDVSIENVHQTAGDKVWKSEHHQAAILIQVRFKTWLKRRQ